MVRVKAQSLSLAVLLCFYVIFAFSINPFMDDFLGMSIEVTDQKNEGVFSSLSRNFDQTVEEINSADEKSTSQPPQPTPLTVLMKRAHPQPNPQPTPLTVLMKRALLRMSQLPPSNLQISLAAILRQLTTWGKIIRQISTSKISRPYLSQIGNF